MSMIDPVGGTFEPLPSDVNNTALSAAQNPQSLQDLINSLDERSRRGDVAATETLFNYLASEQSAKTARDWTSAREDTQYQRLMADLKKAGISPYILTGATPGVSSSSGVSHSGNRLTTQQTNQWNQQKGENDRAINIVGEILGFIGTALMALAIFG